MIIKEIDDIPLGIINRYKNLRLGKENVNTPYYLNPLKKRNELRSLAGKGDPDEIEEEVVIYAKLRDVDLKSLDSDQIRQFMKTEGIGIDCSGFVAHVFDGWLKTSGKRGISNYIKYENLSIFRKLVTMIRPIENMGVKSLTNKVNAEKVDIEIIRVGDVIRSTALGHGEHIMLVTKLVYDDQNNLIEIVYTHSTPHYSDCGGIREGSIKIVSTSTGLESQVWEEEITKQGFIKDIMNNGIFRLNLMKYLL